MLCVGVFFWRLFSDVPLIYDVFSLYSLIHRSLFVLQRDQIVK